MCTDVNVQGYVHRCKSKCRMAPRLWRHLGNVKMRCGSVWLILLKTSRMQGSMIFITGYHISLIVIIIRNILKK